MSWALSGTDSKHVAVCNWLVYLFARTADPDKPSRIALNAFPDKNGFDKTLTVIDETLYNKARFSDKAKYGMLREAAIKHSELSEFLLFKSIRCESTEVQTGMDKQN